MTKQAIRGNNTVVYLYAPYAKIVCVEEHELNIRKLFLTNLHFGLQSSVGGRWLTNTAVKLCKDIRKSMGDSILLNVCCSSSNCGFSRGSQ